MSEIGRILAEPYRVQTVFMVRIPRNLPWVGSLNIISNPPDRRGPVADNPLDSAEAVQGAGSNVKVEHGIQYLDPNRGEPKVEETQRTSSTGLEGIDDRQVFDTLSIL